ncbi:uncharacterized protein [Haliotis cracherodii]|uniref:uncharacterized protein n=1 Tax=Haliotis cracherodii TaxID=6455 RepID=UPI0039E82049
MSVRTDLLDYIPVEETVKNMVEAVSAVCHGDYALAKEKVADAALGVITGGVKGAAITVAERQGIDWLDYIPVEETVKKIVEAVSAVCHGDYALAKEKVADAALGVITGGVKGAAITVAERQGIDWLDYIPVEETVKKIVEAASAVCHGDYALAKEKVADAALGVITGGVKGAAITVAERQGIDWLNYIPVEETVKKIVEAVSAVCLGDYALAKEKGADAALGVITGGVKGAAITVAERQGIDWLNYIPVEETVKKIVEAVSAVCLGDYALAKEKGADAALGVITGGVKGAAITVAERQGIDWLDYIPVEETVKKIVEAASAVCHGDYALAKEKVADAALGVITGGVKGAAITVAERQGIDWLNYIPVEETVKKIVEAVSAVCLGDYALAKEKGADAALGVITGGVKGAAITVAERQGIDWLDYIPVVGTVKNTVEAISAVCHGDYALAIEKGADAALGVITGGVNVAAIRVAQRLVLRGIGKKVAMTVMSTMGRKAAEKLVEATKVQIKKLTNKSNRPGDQR